MPLASIPATSNPSSSRKTTDVSVSVSASRVVTALFCVPKAYVAAAPAVSSSVSVVPLIAALWVTAPFESRVTIPVASMPATSNPSSSRKTTDVSVSVSASRVVTALFCVPKAYVAAPPAVPSSVRVLPSIAALWVTAPLLSSVTMPLASMPATSNPSSSRKTTDVSVSLFASSVTTTLLEVPSA